MGRWPCGCITFLCVASVLNGRYLAEASCNEAGVWLATTCQQFHSAVASWPGLSGKDNDTIEVPINPVRIHNWYMMGHTECNGHDHLYFCKCCYSFANFLSQSCRCNQETARWLASGGVTDEQWQSVTIAAAIACGKHGNISLRDPQHGRVCANGTLQS